MNTLASLQSSSSRERWRSPTHVLAANLRAALLESFLDVFLLIALVVAQTSDEVV